MGVPLWHTVPMGKTNLSAELNSYISERVKKWMEDLRLNPHALARKAGLNHGNLSRMVKGERGWTLGNLEQVASALGVPIAEILQEVRPVPLVATISVKEGFDYGRLAKGESLELVPCVVEVEPPMRKDVYALKIEDQSCLPFFKPGAVIYARKNSYQEIEQDDLVIYCGSNGRGDLRRISFTDGNFIILKSLNPSQSKDLVIPKDHLKVADKVIGAKY